MLTVRNWLRGAALIGALMSALAIAYLMVVDWVLDGNGVSSPYLGPSESLLEPRPLGRVVANSTGYFDSDFGCKSVYRHMDYDAGLYRPFVLNSTRCMCMDTEFD